MDVGQLGSVFVLATAVGLVIGLLLGEGDVNAGVGEAEAGAAEHGVLLGLDGQVVGQQLELGGAGAVVRNDGADAAVFAGSELIPELVLVGLLADGRAALVAGITILDVVRGETEVVEARLSCDVDAAGAGVTQDRDSLGGRQVDDVQVQLRGEVGHGENLLNGIGLKCGRARLEEGRVAGELTLGGQGWFGAGDTVADRVGDGREHLGVEHEGRRGVLEGGHGESNVGCGDGRELVDSRLDEESLEATDTGLDKGKQLVSVAGDDAAIEANIDPALVLSSSKFYPEAFKCGGGRYGVQWHVDDGGDTARSSRPRASRKAFPFCTAGLVEVDMGVDQARDYEFVAVVHICGRFGKGFLGVDSRGYEDDLAGGGGDGDGGGCEEERVVRLSENGPVGDEHHKRLRCRVREEG